MELFHGRPPSAEGRLPKEMWVYDLLDRLDILYTRADHAAAMTMDDCAEINRTLGVSLCKNLFLCNRQNTAFYLLLMPGSKAFHTKDLSAQLGTARLSFADAASMECFLDITPGSVSVMGVMNDTDNRVQLLIDKPIAEAPFLGCHPCVNTSSLRLTMQDVLTRFLPAVYHAPIIVDLPEYEMHKSENPNF